MKVVIAIDSYKGSLSSLQAGQAAAAGVRRVYPTAEITVLPIADGGEGTVDALAAGLNGERRAVCVTGPTGAPVQAEYCVINRDTAVMEMSAAAGITLLSPAQRNPLYTTTYGVGEMIADAIRVGCRHFIIGIGGSATNDGGLGMLQALGFRMLDKDGNDVPRGAIGLRELCRIDRSHALPALADCTFEIACDVTNPLCGENGCSAVYGPQKGADAGMIAQMDLWLSQYADIAKDSGAAADKEHPGAGAAGGLGFAFLAFLGGRLTRGIELILQAIGLEKHMATADFAITGEGRLDAQTAMGKAPAGVAEIAKRHGATVLAFGGSIAKDASFTDTSIDACFSILKSPISLAEAMDIQTAAENMSDAVCQVFRLIKALGK